MFGQHSGVLSPPGQCRRIMTEDAEEEDGLSRLGRKKGYLPKKKKPLTHRF